jgi:hypothetical protein
VPSPNVRIECPLALVDKVLDNRPAEAREAANAFANFLFTSEAQVGAFGGGSCWLLPGFCSCFDLLGGLSQRRCGGRVLDECSERLPRKPGCAERAIPGACFWPRWGWGVGTGTGTFAFRNSACRDVLPCCAHYTAGMHCLVCTRCPAVGPIPRTTVVRTAKRLPEVSTDCSSQAVSLSCPAIVLSNICCTAVLLWLYFRLTLARLVSG